jgi:putative pectin methyltransferase
VPARVRELCALLLQRHRHRRHLGSRGGGVISYERQCTRDGRVACLIAPPRRYRIPVRWPSGKGFIWKDNIRISGQEFSLGSLFKR